MKASFDGLQSRLEGADEDICRAASADAPAGTEAACYSRHGCPAGVIHPCDPVPPLERGCARDAKVTAGTLKRVTARTLVVFPVHLRTLQRIEALGGASRAQGLRLVEPQGYLDFLALTVFARAVITDSGGVQEETTYLGVPCLTVRPNTERPITISKGTNRLVGGRRDALLAAVDEVLAAKPSAGEPQRPELWDGKAAERIVQDILEQQ